MSSDNTVGKTPTSANGVAATVTVKVEPGLSSVTPPDNSELSLIQQLLWVDLSKDDSEMVEKALTNLADACLEERKDEENATVIFEASGAVLIALAMKKWYLFPEIQAEGCRALQNIGSDSDQFTLSCKGIGAINALTWAMKNYPNNSQVQLGACGALSAMVKIKMNTIYITDELNGIELIIAAMNAFKNNAELQFFASRALDGIAKWDEFKGAIVEAGGRRSLVEAIENHKNESEKHVKDLQEVGKHVLKKLF